jgi:hypothetical protein
MANRTSNGAGYHFMTASDPVTRPSGVIDLGSAQKLASFRLYALLNTDITYSYMMIQGAEDAMSYCVNNFKLYGSNDNATWTEVGEYFQNPSIDPSLFWCYPAFDANAKYSKLSDLEAADPCWVEVSFDVMDTAYRYLKVEFISAFRSTVVSTKKIVAAEMEVYVGR